MSHKEAPETQVDPLRRLAGVYRRMRYTVEAIDERFRQWERRYGCRALRYSLALVFFWFGITKPLAISPADQVVRPTLVNTPILSELISFQLFFGILGIWEALVGLGLLWRRTVRLAVACMCIQMMATFTPLFVIPSETFRWWPLVPSAPGFYIFKNFALATAGLVVASVDSKPLFGALRARRSPFAFNFFRWAIRVEVASREHQPRFAWSPVSEIRKWIEKWIKRPIRTGLSAFGTTLSHLSVRSLHVGLALVFVWSGILMVSASPVPGQWIASVIPNSLMANSVVIPLFGVLELAIGLYLLIPGARGTHAAAYLSLGYISMTMLPVVMQPSQVFASIPFEPTFEGVYIFKDLILVAGVLTVDTYLNDGSLVDDGGETFDDEDETDTGSPDPTGA